MHGWLERIDSSDRLTLTFQNDTAGRRTEVTLIGIDGSQLPLARYDYDARGRMVDARCSYGRSIQYAWHPDRDLLAAWRSSAGRSQSHFAYDAEGRVTHTKTNGLWNDDRFHYDPAQRRTRYEPAGQASSSEAFTYDDRQNVTGHTDALGHATSYQFEEAGLRTATIDPLGHVTGLSYDPWGNITRTVDAEGRQTL